MKAFHNDQKIKDSLIYQLQAHYDADEIVKGVYWQNGKGCAIGCAIHSSDHKLYQIKFDIPVWLARVQDVIFEGLQNDKAKEWPLLFTKSVNVGSNLDKIKIPFLIFVVESVLNKFDHKKFKKVKSSIDNVINLLKNGYQDTFELRSAYFGAVDAAAYANTDCEASALAAAYASDDAYSTSTFTSAHAYAAASAAYASASSAASAYAAASAASAACSAAYADTDADAAVSYASATSAQDGGKELQYTEFANKLIDLIRGER